MIQQEKNSLDQQDANQIGCLSDAIWVSIGLGLIYVTFKFFWYCKCNFFTANWVVLQHEILHS